MSEFDYRADPELIAARAAELATEQLDRLRVYLMNNPGKGSSFYSQTFETVISNKIGKLMGAYAILKGYVKSDLMPTPSQ